MKGAPSSIFLSVDGASEQLCIAQVVHLSCRDVPRFGGRGRHGTSEPPTASSSSSSRVSAPPAPHNNLVVGAETTKLSSGHTRDRLSDAAEQYMHPRHIIYY